MQLSGLFVICSTMVFGAVASWGAADPLAELSKFSAFEQLDLSKLATGKALVARGPTLSFPRDLSVQAVYLVPAPLSKAYALHRKWEPGKTSDLKVFLHNEIGAKPTAADFAKLASAPNNSAVRALTAATQKLPAKDALQLTAAEAQQFTKSAGGGAFPSSAFWSQILLHRAQNFASRGLPSQPPYEVGGQSIRASEEVARLLKTQPKIRAQFRALTDEIVGGAAPSGGYWELFDADGMAALSLAGTYGKETAEGAQHAEVQYFASDGFLVLITLYQMWPVTVDNKPATLVWRGDSISSVALGELRGIERMGSGAAMMKEVQKGIHYFQKDASK